MIPKLGLSEENRKGVIDVLNTVLADEHVLYTKLRNYHWNVTGPQFHALHEFFERQYDEVKAIADTVAERTRAHGGFAIGTLNEFLQRTRFQEQPGEYPKAGTMVANLVADHEAMVRTLRNDAHLCSETYEDTATEDLLIGLMQTHEEMAWMLRSFIEGESV
ncbi:MAG: DNA starvation/stationary phase protection protein [Anaerolineae bacterium]|nr:DNA starvation/stationary phase protection protein [Anaerolineae bacterium]